MQRSERLEHVFFRPPYGKYRIDSWNHLVLTTTLPVKYYDPHFTDEHLPNITQLGNSPNINSLEVAEAGFGPRSVHLQGS